MILVSLFLLSTLTFANGDATNSASAAVSPHICKESFLDLADPILVHSLDNLAGLIIRLEETPVDLPIHESYKSHLLAGFNSLEAYIDSKKYSHDDKLLIKKDLKERTQRLREDLGQKTVDDAKSALERHLEETTFKRLEKEVIVEAQILEDLERKLSETDAEVARQEAEFHGVIKNAHVMPLGNVLTALSKTLHDQKIKQQALKTHVEAQKKKLERLHHLADQSLEKLTLALLSPVLDKFTDDLAKLIVEFSHSDPEGTEHISLKTIIEKKSQDLQALIAESGHVDITQEVLKKVLDEKVAALNKEWEQTTVELKAKEDSGRKYEADMARPSFLFTEHLHLPENITSAHFTADNRFFLFDTQEGGWFVRELTSGEDVMSGTGMISQVSPDSQFIAVENKGELHFFDLLSGKETFKNGLLKPKILSHRTAQLLNGGLVAYVTDSDRSIEIMDLRTEAVKRTFPSVPEKILLFRLDPQLKTIFIQTQRNSLSPKRVVHNDVWKISEWEGNPHFWEEHKDRTYLSGFDSLAIPDASFSATGGILNTKEDQSFHHWEIRTDLTPSGVRILHQVTLTSPALYGSDRNHTIAFSPRQAEIHIKGDYEEGGEFPMTVKASAGNSIISANWADEGGLILIAYDHDRGIDIIPTNPKARIQRFVATQRYTLKYPLSIGPIEENKSRQVMMSPDGGFIFVNNGKTSFLLRREEYGGGA